MNKEGIFSPEAAKFYAANIIDIIEFLAKQDIIIRDIRPESFMV